MFQLSMEKLPNKVFGGKYTFSWDIKFTDVSFIWKSLAKIFPGNQIGQVVQVLIAFESKRIQLRDGQGSVPSIDVSYVAGKMCRLTTSHVQVGSEWNGTFLKMFFVHNLKSLTWERMLKPGCHITFTRAFSTLRFALKEILDANKKVSSLKM